MPCGLHFDNISTYGTTMLFSWNWINFIQYFARNFCCLSCYQMEMVDKIRMIACIKSVISIITHISDHHQIRIFKEHAVDVNSTSFCQLVSFAFTHSLYASMGLLYLFTQTFVQQLPVV